MIGGCRRAGSVSEQLLVDHGEVGQPDPAAPAAYKAQLEARAGHDVWDRLDAITCPTLVGYGNYDGIAPVQNSTTMASRIRGAELRGYEGGHLFLFQDPAALPEFEAFLRAPSR